MSRNNFKLFGIYLAYGKNFTHNSCTYLSYTDNAEKYAMLLDVTYRYSVIRHIAMITVHICSLNIYANTDSNISYLTKNHSFIKRMFVSLMFDLFRHRVKNVNDLMIYLSLCTGGVKVVKKQ